MQIFLYFLFEFFDTPFSLFVLVNKNFQRHELWRNMGVSLKVLYQFEHNFRTQFLPLLLINYLSAILNSCRLWISLLPVTRCRWGQISCTHHIIIIISSLFDEVNEHLTFCQKAAQCTSNREITLNELKTWVNFIYFTLMTWSCYS